MYAGVGLYDFNEMVNVSIADKVAVAAAPSRSAKGANRAVSSCQIGWRISGYVIRSPL